MKSRRSFLAETAAYTTLGALTGCGSPIPSGGEAGQQPVTPPWPTPLLMPDDFSELHLTAWRVEPGTPDPENPLLEGDMPWDAGGIGIHGSVFKDPRNGRWKAYLVATPPEETAVDWRSPWASINHAKRRLCLFESDDGVHWSRPPLANASFGQHEKTNIIFDLDQGTAAYSSVMVDEGDTGMPYEMYVLRWASVEGETPAGTGYYRYRSRDGYHWELSGEPIYDPMSGDLCFFYRYGPGEYVAYYRLGGKKQPGDHVPIYEDAPRRTVYRATSEDGGAWKRDESMILTLDERDHRDTQYQELVPHRVPGGYLGMVTIYWPLTQTLNLRLAASRDGSRWWYPDRRPCLDNAPLGDYGGGMIWQSQYLVEEGGRMHLYYGGTEGAHRQIFDTRAPSQQVGYMEDAIDHGAHFLPFNSALCRASWKVGRMYALIPSAGGPTLGMAVTRDQDLANRSLRVNVVTRPAKKSSKPDLDAGYLQVELLDSEDRPLEGFSRKDCSPLKGDHTALQVSWRRGDRAPEGARKAKFYLKRAFLYGFGFYSPW